MRFKAETAKREMQEHPQSKRIQSQLDALAEIDAFVMEHASMEAREFFRQLRRLDAWRTLSSSGETETKEDGVTR